MTDLNLFLGILGMALLLVAFVLNLMKIKGEGSKIYIIMNILGAGTSTYYAFTLEAVPFIILEAVWCLFAVYKLFFVIIKKADSL